MFDAGNLQADDRVMLALALDWTIGADAHLALTDTDALSTTVEHLTLRALHEFAPTVLIATPSDALRVTYDAAHRQVDLTETFTRLVVLTGEPGGSLNATRRLIREGWAAECLDVYALSELGVIGWSCAERPGHLHLDDRELRFDVYAPNTDRSASDGESGELVVTLPSTWSSSLENCRTGDFVQLERSDCACGRSAPCAAGGVLGRVRDLLTVRGRELLPSAIEEVVRRHPAVVDFRLRIYAVGGQCEVAVELETSDSIASEGDRARVAAEVAEDLRRSIGMRLQCDVVTTGSFADEYDDGHRARRLKRR